MPTCFEDMSCWDGRVMGNKIIGILFELLDGSQMTLLVKFASMFVHSV